MNKIVYFNGKFIPEEKASVPITTHALHYGTGCFEGIRAYYNKDRDALYVFRMEDHYKRLMRSCKVMHISLPNTITELCDITRDLVKKNFSQTDIYIRPLAYKSDPAVGNFNLKNLRDGFLIYTVPLGRHLDTQKGIRTHISSWIRVSNNSIPPKAKITGSYANTSLAKTESAIAGFDEALMSDSKGNIVEGSAENIFIVKSNVLITPPTSDDILVGITRDTVKIIAKEKLKMDTVEKSISKKELYQADEVFLVGTGAEIAEVIEIDGKIIGNNKVKSVFSKINHIYLRMVHGELPEYIKYLTKISK